MRVKRHERKGGQSANLPLEKLYVDQRGFYRKIYESSTSAPWEKAFDPGRLQQTLLDLGDGKGKRALDIGAGRGRGSAILADHGYHAVGMDYLFNPLATASSAKNGGRRRPAFVNADLFAAPFRKESFDLALDWGVFHHIRRKDTAKYMETLTRLLKPGGVFLLGCFSTSFRHDGEGDRKRNWLVHRGHYDRFSTKEELKQTFAPLFTIMSIKETVSGFYHAVMRRKG